MDTTLKLAIETYALITGYTELEIIKMIQDDDEAVRNSILHLMEGVA